MDRALVSDSRADEAAKPTPLGEVVAAAVQIGEKLLGSKLFLAYVVLGVLSGLRFGAQGLGIALVNYLVLLPLYVLMIRVWTKGEPTVTQVLAQDGVGRSRAIDAALVGAALVVNLGTLVWFWADGFPVVVMDAVQTTLRGAGWDRALANRVANGVESSLFNLLPSLVLVFLLFRLRPRQVGLVPRRLDLGLMLVALGIGAAYMLRLAFGSSSELFAPGRTLSLVLALYASQIFINALQEELVFRGVIFTRLLSGLANPLHALALMVVFFSALHIPSFAFSSGGATLWDWLPISYQPTGLVWGYLFYRTRSIWPGVLWHASNGVLGVLFLGW